MWIRFVIKNGDEQFTANMVNVNKAIRIYPLSLRNVCEGFEDHAPYTLALEFPASDLIEGITKQHIGLFRTQEALKKFFDGFWERLPQEKFDLYNKTYAMTVEYDVSIKEIPEILYNVKRGKWTTREGNIDVD